MNFVEWFAEGAAFGFRAFFALFVFGACIMALLGLMAIIGAFFAPRQGDDDE